MLQAIVKKKNLTKISEEFLDGIEKLVYLSKGLIQERYELEYLWTCQASFAILLKDFQHLQSFYYRNITECDIYHH